MTEYKIDEDGKKFKVRVGGPLDQKAAGCAEGVGKGDPLVPEA